MARGRVELADRMGWKWTAEIIAMVHNVNCGKRSQMRPAKEFNPYAAKAAGDWSDMPEDEREQIKQMFG